MEASASDLIPDVTPSNCEVGTGGGMRSLAVHSQWVLSASADGDPKPLFCFSSGRRTRVRPPAGALPSRWPAATKMSSDGQLGHQNLSLGLGAQQHGDKEDGQPDYRGDEDWARKGDVVGGCV